MAYEQNEQKEQENEQDEYVGNPILIFSMEVCCDTMCMKGLYTFWSVVEVYEHVNDTFKVRHPKSKDYNGECYGSRLVLVIFLLSAKHA